MSPNLFAMCSVPRDVLDMTVALSLVLLCSLASITWCLWLRSISKLLEKIAKYHMKRTENTGGNSKDDTISHSSAAGLDMKMSEMLLEKDEDSWDVDIDVSETGKDFLFLFDLLAHTAGIEVELSMNLREFILSQ